MVVHTETMTHINTWNGSSSANASASKPSKSRQLSINELMKEQEPLVHSLARWQQIAKAVCYHIAKNTQPLILLSTVNDTLSTQGIRAQIHFTRSQKYY